MMTALAMHMTMRDFLGAGHANFCHTAVKNQRDTCERMIAVDNHLALGNIGDAIDEIFFAIITDPLE